METDFKLNMIRPIIYIWMSACTRDSNKVYLLQLAATREYHGTYLLSYLWVSARGHSDTPDVIMTLLSYFCGLPGVARKARKQYSDVIMTELFLRSPRSCPKGAFTKAPKQCDATLC